MGNKGQTWNFMFWPTWLRNGPFIMRHFLLTGAGFSRNWGCWVADEVFEYLLAEPQLSPLMRTQLWRDKNSQCNYETTVQALRDAAVTHKGKHEEEYRNFLSILGGMFNQMRDTYVQSGFQFEKTTDSQYMITQFLYQFDAIFTLNQDTLLEHHYFTEFFHGQSGGRWKGWDLPGVHDLGEPLCNNPYYTATTLKGIDESGFSSQPQHQPYFKLHGSHNWTTKSGLLWEGWMPFAVVVAAALLSASILVATRTILVPVTWGIGEGTTLLEFDRWTSKARLHFCEPRDYHTDRGTRIYQVCAVADLREIAQSRAVPLDPDP
jgi:hypothetical protein